MVGHWPVQRNPGSIPGPGKIPQATTIESTALAVPATQKPLQGEAENRNWR